MLDHDAWKWKLAFACALIVVAIVFFRLSGMTGNVPGLDVACNVVGSLFVLAALGFLYMARRDALHPPQLRTPFTAA